MNIVHPTGDILRFFVESSRPGVPPYLVDLKAWWLNGGCDCQSFTMRCEPHLRKRRHLSQEQRDKLPPVVCKHIISAQRFAFREWLGKLAQGEVLTESGEESNSA